MKLLRKRDSRSFWLSSFQLIGAIIVAGILPYLFRLVTFGDGASVLLHTQTLFVVIGSTTLAYWFMRNLIAYPGVEKSSNILMSLSISYGIVAILLIFARVEYSRFMLFSGYIISVGWFYWITINYARKTKFRVGFAPFGNVSGMEDIAFVSWVALPHPAVSIDGIDAVAVDLRADIPDAWERALADFALKGIPVYHIKHLRESITGQVELEYLSENNFGSLSPVSAYMTFKHAIDWVSAVVALVISAPIIIVCCFLVKLGSPGTAFFRQQRIGYQGRLFRVYKLRTMTMGKSLVNGDRNAAMTRDNDHRVTRIGRYLRKYRLDELPQLINIIKGEMSWIGPRPEAEILSKWYETEIPFYRYRHIVRPGITGWAQVNQGHVAEIGDVKTKLNFDFYYIKNFSPWLDILITARTIRTVLTGSGAR